MWGESKSGVTQGDPESGPCFCVAIQEYVTKVDRMLPEGGGCARFGWDDGYLLGPAELVFSALDMFNREVETNCGLVLQRTKTEVFSWGGTLPAGTPHGLVNAGTVVAGVWEPGTICQLLEGERQSLWTVLRSSISQKLDYWLTLVYPTLVKAEAERMDRLMWKVL